MGNFGVDLGSLEAQNGQEGRVMRYADDVPLEGPKAKMVKKWSGNGFGPFQMTCPKSGQKVPKKWSKKGPRQIWDHKKTNFAWVF